MERMVELKKDSVRVLDITVLEISLKIERERINKINLTLMLSVIELSIVDNTKQAL